MGRRRQAGLSGAPSAGERVSRPTKWPKMPTRPGAGLGSAAFGGCTVAGVNLESPVSQIALASPPVIRNDVPHRATDMTDLSPIRLLILDVDGVLTTGALPYNVSGNTVKSFFVQDGSAVKLWQRSGGIVAILSGRASKAVNARAKDLSVQTVVQGVAEKLPAYETICRQAGVADDAVSVIGDDWLDIEPMGRCAYPIAVANAIAPVKRAARYVTRRPGGEGAVAEAIERLLRHNGVWDETTAPLRR